MSSKTQTFLLVSLVLVVGCSGPSKGLRTDVTEASSRGDGRTDQTSNSDDSRPNDDGEGVLGYTEANNPVPINGTNLVEVLVFAHCVNQGANVCSQVRLSAKIKVNSREPVRFAADTVSGLGIKSSSWDVAPFAGVTCQTTGGGHDFNPLCTASSGSLAQAKIKATLKLVATDGSMFKGESPDSIPGTGKVYGNFMLLDPSAGLAVPVPPVMTKYPGASADFTQIWAVLKGGENYLEDLKHVSYLTNILYDGGGTPSGTDWGKSKSLCASVDSGDGAGKWRLPDIWELCGAHNESAGGPEPCSGGVSKHGINNVPFAEGYRTNGAFWSSSQVYGFSALDWYDLFFNELGGFAYHHGDGSTFNSVFCVR